MYASLFTAPNPINYAIPFFIIGILTEWYVVYRESRAAYNVPNAAASIGVGLVSLMFDIPTKIIAFLGFSWLYAHRLVDIPVAWWSVALLFLLDDFTFYWQHRLHHEHRILWAGHVCHHSSEHYNLAVALRQPWLEKFYVYGFWAWLAWLGFPPLLMFTVMSFNLVYQFWVHTERVVRLPAIVEFVFNTPSHHRVHHASNTRYLDRNHGGVLIIWDRIFGSFTAEDPTEPVVYGITTNIYTNNLFRIAFHEYIAVLRDMLRSGNVRTAWNYAWQPPGWNETDGDAHTARALRRK